MNRIIIEVKEYEEKIIPFISLGNLAYEVTVEAHLIGEGARLHIVGIFLGGKNNDVTFNTDVIHKACNTKSVTTIRGVFKEKSSFNNDGMIRIRKGAKGSDGYFASKILLFDSAKGRSVPSLEIDENELKAGHASTIGRPDAEQIFYLKSRGLSEKQAESLIISGFFKPAVAMLPVNEQKNIEEQLNTYLKYNTIL